MPDTSYDLVIIGAGPGGYTSAIRASQLGWKVAVVEKDRPGGVCLHWGCIPSKAILHCAELLEAMKEAGRYGIHCQGLSVDFGKVIDHSRKIADQLAQGIHYLFKKSGIDLIHGAATLLSASALQVQGKEARRVSAPRMLVATGSREKRLPGLEVDGSLVVTSYEALQRRELPQSVLIIGGGAVGVEFAYAYNSFGVPTAVVEMMDHLLPEMDDELGHELERSFKKRKIKLLTQTRYKGMVRSADGQCLVTVEGRDGKEASVSADMVLVAVGREPFIEGLGLEKLGVETEKGFVKVDERYQTSCKGIYAVGDVIGPPLLAHAAAAEGVAAVEMMVGRKGKKVERWNIPACVYCQPEVASIGLTEREGKAKGIEMRIGKFPFRASGKAGATGHTEGWVKVISAENGAILGAHMIGKGVTELIAEAALAQSMEATARGLGQTIHAHPTLSEALKEASLAVYGEAINV